MKRWIPYLLGAVALIVLIALVISAPPVKNRKLDERITLRQKDKIPYGTFIAKELLAPLFPNAIISVDKREPGYWQEVSLASSQQAVFLVARSFEPEEYELKRLAEFVRQGNYVFIIAKSLSYEATEFFRLTDSERFFHMTSEDSLAVTLKEAETAIPTSFIYPGKKYDSYFSSLDTPKVVRLGNDPEGNTNFIQLQAGAGKLFIHLAPLTFSNYFILHKNNVAYFQKVVSLIPQDVDKVLWNEYYLTKRKIKQEEEPGVLSVLWQYPSFRWALITIITTLLLYVFIEMRRRQRLIPVWARPSNDSLDFVRTMGRLYYDRSDHLNLSKKMAGLFLDHVRARYKLATHSLDDVFIKELHLKSGYPVKDLHRIVSFIHYIHTAPAVSERQLSDWYQQLENFYQTT